MMKRIIGTLSLFLGLSCMACDLCGCYMGVQPQLEKNAIGLRWRYRYFSGNVPHIHGNGEVHEHESSMSYDHYNTLDLYGRWYPHKRVQLFALVPYVANSLEGSGTIEKYRGLGDVMFLAQYSLLSKTNIEKDVVQQLFAGGGVKLPTGKYNVKASNGELEPHSQAGTGSFDFLVTANYLLRRKKIGLNAEAAYRISTENNLDFQFANRFNMATHLFYWGKIKDVSIMPHVGYYFETAGLDQLNGRDYLNTGGTIVFGSAGIETYLGKFKLSYTFQLPLYESLIGYQVNNKMRMISGIAYYFN